MTPAPDNTGLDVPEWGTLWPDAVDQKSAVGHWDGIVAEMRTQQKLAGENSHAISRLVIARVTYEQMARHVAQHGAMVQAPKTKVWMQNPALSIMNKQAEICAQLEAELTLSPRKRATGGKVATKRAAGGTGGGVTL